MSTLLRLIIHAHTATGPVVAVAERHGRGWTVQDETGGHRQALTLDELIVNALNATGGQVAIVSARVDVGSAPVPDRPLLTPGQQHRTGGTQ